MPVVASSTLASVRARARADQIKTGIRRGDLYAFPRQKSVDHFKDQIRKLTCRKAPVTTQALIDQINPIIRGWGNYFSKAHVRKLFARLDRWIIRRIHAHRYKRWRCRGYRTLPERKLYGEYGLVRLIALIPSILSATGTLVKAVCRKTARTV